MNSAIESILRMMAASAINNRPQRLFPVSERFLFSLALALFSLFMLLFGWTQRVDYIIYDNFLKWRPVPTTTSSAIVAIDENSLSNLGRWPWERDIHAKLIKKLNAAGAEVIIFDMLLTEAGTHSADHTLQQAMSAAGNILLPMHIDHRSASGRMTEILPIPDYVAVAAGLGHVHFELDEDGIARGLYLYQGLGDSHWPSLALAAFERVNVLSTPGDSEDNLNPSLVGLGIANQPATMPLKQDDRTATTPGSELLNVREGYRLIPYIGAPGSFATLSYSDVLNSELPADYFIGRVVFVGATAAGLGDFIATPMSGEYVNMPGVEVHANVYEALVNSRLKAMIAPIWQYSLTIGLVLVVSMIFPKLSPGKNLALVVACCCMVGIFSYSMLFLKHLWFAPATLIITILSAYPFWSWRRLLRLNRFLHQELERLADEPSLRPASNDQSVQQWAQQLVRLLKPEIWEFREYQHNGELQVKSDQILNQAEIYVPVNNQQNLSTLYMKFKAQPEILDSIVNYINRLFPGIKATSPPHIASGELMDRRIWQVRSAIAAMRDMRQFISDTVANMPDGVMVGDELGRVLFMNDPALQWLQGDPQSGSFIADVMPVNNRLSPALWETRIHDVLLREQSLTEELHRHSKAVLTTLVPINFTNNHRGLVITFSDITVIHEAQQKRLETIHFISHDLRAPLASQLALLDLLKASLPREFRNRLLTAQKLTEKSLTMADQFLQLARIESADHIHLYECELLDIVDNAVDATTPLAQKQLVKLNTTADCESYPVHGNPELLERCLVNLIQNAIKFSPARSSIDIHIQPEQEHVIVSLQDHGQGIELKEIPHIFEPYRRTHASEQQGIAGSGLGLRFVKLVADRHGGQIKVDSTPGQGARFSLYLPNHNTIPT